MINLQGLGIWVWQESQCERGDWNAIAQKCKNAGIKWIVAKSGDSSRYANWTSAHLKEVIQICHDNGLLFGTWNYSIPSTAQAQIAQIKSLFDDGVDLHIIDAEVEWQTTPDSSAQAEAFMQALRAAVGNDVFLGHAPFAVVNYHPQFPYTAFGKYVNAVFPQNYWTEFNWPIQKAVITTDSAWQVFNMANPTAAKPVYDIGVSYGKGYPGVAGVLNAQDIKTFISHYNGAPCSFYSYDAAFPLFWETLAELNAPPVPISTVKSELPVSRLAKAMPQRTSIWDRILGWIVKVGKLVFSIH
jgi:hypothetical protein